MDQRKLKEIGYRKHYYGPDNSSDTKQCFHCKYKKSVEGDPEKVQCTRWIMVTDEDDVCDYFDFAKLWAFNYSDEDRERRNRKFEQAKNAPREGCYIATAVYGGYDQPEVLRLRQYRDEVLKQTAIGRAFIKIYYFVSPRLAEKLKKPSWINRTVRSLLDRFVKKLDKN